MSGTISSPLAEQLAIVAAEEIIAATADRGGAARALGGVAVALRCPSAQAPGPLARSYSDVDLAIDRASAPAFAGAMEGLGYEAERRFNAVQGHRRMVFERADGVHVDVFVDEFVMCHRLSLGERLRLHDMTVPLADLLLTKLQVAELNAKDVTDAAALLLDHALTTNEDGVNSIYITDLLTRDWGWWRTVCHNLRALPAHLDGRLAEGSSRQVAMQVEGLLEAIDRAPKSMRWRARAKAGERLAWRNDPEESAG